MTLKNKQQPFSPDDMIINYLETDSNFRRARKNSFYNFKTIFHPSIFMSLKQQYTNFAHLITKNAIVATVLMLLALTTVSASAAELFAPNEFKPSAILNLRGTEVQNEPVIATSSSSSSVSSTTVSSSSVTSINSQTPAETKLIYINPNIPNFKLDYTGWSLNEKKEKTTLGDGSNQDSRGEEITLTFSKSQNTIKFVVNTYSIGGIPGSTKTVLERKDISSGNIKTTRAKLSDSVWQYGQPATGLTPFTEYDKNNQLAAIFWTIEYNGSSSFLPEVDEIVLNSGIKFE